MLRWLATRRQRKQEEALEAAGASVRRLFPEPIAFVAQAWVRMVNHMLHVAPQDWNSRSLDTRILAFKGMSSALEETPQRFGFVQEKITEAASRSGASEEQVRKDILIGILAEAIVATGENRSEVTAALFLR